MANLKTKKEISMQNKRGSSQTYSSPTFKAIAADYNAGKITAAQAVNKVVPKGSPEKLKTMAAQALGIQSGIITVAKITQKVNENRAKKTQTRKPGKRKPSE